MMTGINLRRALGSVVVLACACIGLSAQQPKMFERMADSEMKRFPEAWQIDWAKRPSFGYCQGVVTLAMLKTWKATGNDKYYDYVEKYADMMVQEDGSILNYDYVNGKRNVDMINTGKILFDVYEQTKNPKYKKAMDLLYNAMMDHPRNSLGGFGSSAKVRGRS